MPIPFLSRLLGGKGHIWNCTVTIAIKIETKHEKKTICASRTIICANYNQTVMKNNPDKTYPDNMKEDSLIWPHLLQDIYIHYSRINPDISRYTCGPTFRSFRNTIFRGLLNLNIPITNV